MATNTPNFGLIKPAQTDFYDVDDFNDNADILDAELAKRSEKPTSFTAGNFPKFGADGNLLDSGKNSASIPSATDVANKVDKIPGKGLSAQDFTTAEKAKLGQLENYNDAEVRGLIGQNHKAITEHVPKTVRSEIGVHDIRYFDDKLQVKNSDGTWEDVGGGGAKIPLSDCTGILMEVGNGRLTLKWKDPVDLVVSGEVVAEWAMTKLVRKVGGYPTSETDGTLVLTSSVRDQYQNSGYVDTPLTNGTTYYYKLFPVSKANAVNSNNANNISAKPRAYRIFGVSIDLDNLNPLSSVSYTDDAVGMTAGSPAWDNQPIFKDIKPCVLKNGVVQHYLNPSNFNQQANGSGADITSGNAGDAMIEFPKIGLQISTTDNVVTVKVTDAPSVPGFRYYAHSRAAEGDRDKLYIGAYEGSDVDGKLRSLSGKPPLKNQTIGAFRAKAKANGAGYDQLAFFPITLIQCLFLIRFKSLDAQTALGLGYTSGSAPVNTGGTNEQGMYYGDPSNRSVQVKCFGLEDLWGNVYDWIDGLYSDANRNILTAFQNFNDTGTGSQYVNRGQGATANVGGWMSKPQGTTEKGFIAKEASGSSTTYFTDGAELRAGRLPCFGGSWIVGADAGVFELYVNYSASDAHPDSGGRLMYL